MQRVFSQTMNMPTSAIHAICHCSESMATIKLLYPVLNCTERTCTSRRYCRGHSTQRTSCPLLTPWTARSPSNYHNLVGHVATWRTTTMHSSRRIPFVIDMLRYYMYTYMYMHMYINQVIFVGREIFANQSAIAIVTIK